MPRQAPQSVPAPQPLPTSGTVEAPARMQARTERSLTPLHRHTYMGRLLNIVFTFNTQGEVRRSCTIERTFVSVGSW